MAEGVEAPVMEQTDVKAKDPMTDVLDQLKVSSGMVATGTTQNHEKELHRENPAPQIRPNLMLNYIDLETIQELKAQGVLPADFPDKPSELDTDEQIEQAGISLISPHTFGSLLEEARPNLPLIVYVQNARTLQEYADTYNQLNSEFWKKSENERPPIIFYTKNFKLSPTDKRILQGFLFATSPDELQKAMVTARQLITTQNATAFDPKTIAPTQKESYDESTDLREWEHVTANTYETLKHILQRIYLRQRLLFSKYTKLFDEKGGWNDPRPDLAIPIRTILDLGTGEGRIAGMLARLGFKVVGMDISPEMLKRSRERITEEGEGLRGEKSHPGLSYEALQQIIEEDRILRAKGEAGILPTNGLQGEPLQPILDDAKTSRHYVTVEGSFYELEEVLNDYLKQWIVGKQINQDISPEEFFEDYNPYSPEPFPQHMLDEVGFDMATITWNTFCEIGDPKNQKNVIEQILNSLVPGGEIYLEIPNRELEPYKSAVKEYHDAHPEDPYGTVRAPKPDGSGYYPPRYFTDVHELAGWLQSFGCEVNLQEDISSYNVRERTDENIKSEYVLTVRKSRR